MKTVSITILIFGLFFYHFAKIVKSGYETNTWKKALEKGVKRALKYLLIGLLILGLFCFAVSQLKYLKILGYTLISDEKIELIREIMNIILGTKSVAVAFGIITTWTLFIIEISLIFFFIGAIAVKKFIMPYVVRKQEVVYIANEKDSEQKIPFVKRKIFFSFSNLKI